MRTLAYHVATTVDGFIADVHDGVGALLHEGDHVADYLASLQAYDTVIMGRRTYEFGLRIGVTDPYPWADTFVCSRTMTASPASRVTLTAEEPSSWVRRLKTQEGGPIYLCGGGQLARSLLDADLVDELVLKVNPVLLGDGVPLAPHLARPMHLRLRSTKVHGNGVLVQHYDVLPCAQPANETANDAANDAAKQATPG